MPNLAIKALRMAGMQRVRSFEAVRRTSAAGHLLPLTTVGFLASDLSVATLLASFDEGTKRPAEGQASPRLRIQSPPTVAISLSTKDARNQHDARYL